MENNLLLRGERTHSPAALVFQSPLGGRPLGGSVIGERVKLAAEKAAMIAEVEIS